MSVTSTTFRYHARLSQTVSTEVPKQIFYFFHFLHNITRQYITLQTAESLVNSVICVSIDNWLNEWWIHEWI